MSDDVDQLILTRMPHFIAAQYKRVLSAPDAASKVRATLHLYELGIRTLALALVLAETL